MFGRHKEPTTVTDKEKIHEVLSRGVDEVIDTNHLKKRMLAGECLRIKLGIDPTSPNLHLGRSVPLLKLKDFQDLGHQIVFIVGDFTGVIGDTSDKESERPMLSRETIEQNKKDYFAQAGKIIDLARAEVHNNSEWLEKLSYRDIGEHADQFSVADFIARDNIKRRLDAGKRVSLRELLYPLMQGYDSVAVKADVEVGGVDQRFNLLSGRTLQQHFNQEPQDIVMTTFPVEGTDGRKMSSSWGNTINFTDSPQDMYGKVMKVNDELITKYFRVLTRLPLETIQEYEQKLQNGGNPRDIKMKLAQEITTIYHGEKEAQKAQENFVTAFQKRGVPEDVIEIHASEGVKVADVLVAKNITASKSDFMRLQRDGAIKILREAKEIPLADKDVVVEKNLVLKIGKHRFVKFVD